MSVTVTTETPGDRLRRAPARVRWSAAGLWLETALFAFAVAETFMAAHGKSSHGQNGAGQLVMAGVTLIPVAAFWGGCAAVLAMRRARWVRLLAISLQAFFVFGGLLTLVASLVSQDLIGLGVALVFLAVPAGIAGLLLARASREWFSH